MRKRELQFGAAAVALAVAFGVTSASAQEAEDPVAAQIAAAKTAAGFEFLGLLSRLCLAPPVNTAANTNDNLPAYISDPSRVPARELWYAEPAKVFDNLYFVGGRLHSAWALTTSDGIIIIDTIYPYNSEELVIGGLQKVGLDPADIKYVIISHAHGDHIGGAEMLQDRGAQIVMGDADWGLVEQFPNRYSTMAPTREISVTEDTELTLGDTTVKIYQIPGHTPGTLGYSFTVFDNGEPVNVVYSGGTAMGFVATPENYQQYIDSQIRMAEVAAATEASVILSNHSEFDNAVTKIRILRGRADGEQHPFVLGQEWVQRYFDVAEACATAAKLQFEKG